MIGIREIIAYHDKTARDSMTQRFLWEDSPLIIKLRRNSKAISINFNNQIPSKIIVIEGVKRDEYPGEQCRGICGISVDSYWNNIEIIFDTGTTVEYNIPNDIETLFTDLAQYVESNYEEVPSPEDQRLASLLLDDDDMLDI